MTRNPIALIVLALAMLLAPLGTCMAWGHAQAGHAMARPHSAAAMQGDQMHRDRMHGHDGSAKSHFCSACQPLFTGVGKAAAANEPFLTSAPAIMPAVAILPVSRPDRPAHSRSGRAPPIPPPLPVANRVRLQI